MNKISVLNVVFIFTHSYFLFKYLAIYGSSNEALKVKKISYSY